MSLNLLDELVNKKVADSHFKYVGRNFKQGDTIIEVAGTKIGGENFTMFAGPCSVESKEQIISLAEKIKACGCEILRGGAFKPRTSPYTFQGLGDEGIELLAEAKKLTGLPVVSEIMDASQLELFKDVDILQIGAKNMQNFALLKAVGRQEKPVLLKRGFSNTLEELLFSAEYIMAEGNHKVILCERGIRTFEPSTRNTFDIAPSSASIPQDIPAPSSAGPAAVEQQDSPSRFPRTSSPFVPKSTNRVMRSSANSFSDSTQAAVSPPTYAEGSGGVISSAFLRHGM